MKVLIGCEESQEVCKAFRALGHEAYSCDLIECSGGHPEWHIQEDVLDVVKREPWDMGIFFPPCTYLAICGLHYLKTKPERKEQLEKAAELFIKLYNSHIPKVAIENPIGWMNTNWRKPNQIIQPYYFGDPELKTTCLWLKNLPELRPTNMLERPKPNGSVIRKTGKKAGQPYNYYFRQGKSAKRRSKTFPGIAKAMAVQWSNPKFDVAPPNLFSEYEALFNTNL